MRSQPEQFAVVIEKGETSYGAYVPELPGCIAVGETPQEVGQLIYEAIRRHLELLRETGEPIPEPGKTRSSGSRLSRLLAPRTGACYIHAHRWLISKCGVMEEGVDECSCDYNISYITRVPEVCGGRPIIAGTRTPVKSIVGYYKMGLSVEEVLEGLPHLTPAQIYEALSYYHDHQSEIEQDIEESRVEHLIEHYGLKVTADGRLVPNERRE